MSEANKSAHKNAQITTTLVSKERADNHEGEEEKENQFEPSPNPI
jgi:hypothetical protein